MVWPESKKEAAALGFLTGNQRKKKKQPWDQWVGGVETPRHDGSNGGAVVAGCRWWCCHGEGRKKKSI
jgi:hypothetical protein